MGLWFIEESTKLCLVPSNLSGQFSMYAASIETP